MSGLPSDWRSRGRAFARRHLAPRSAAIDREDRLPPELLGQLADAGLLGVGLPLEFGGGGGGTADTAAVLEELAIASPAVATMVAVHLSVAAAPIAQWGTQ